MKKFISYVSAAAILVAGANTLGAQTTESESSEAPQPEASVLMPQECELKSETKFISVVVCEEGISAEKLAEAGRSACDTRLPCGAWVWKDEADIPAQAPEMHDGLTQEEVRSATGVWVAEKELFITINQQQN